MKYTLLICFLIFCFIAFPLIRVIICNLHRIGLYSLLDTVLYIKDQKWKDFNLFGISMFIGMFGHGKTLSMTHQARLIYEKYGDKVRFISNYKLNDIPYIPLINFNQLVDLGEEEEENYIGTVILIDEIENVLSHRNFANFPLPLLHMLTQQRKKRVYILCSAQRFFMVDKLWRSITTNVYNCNKFWRFQHVEEYDAWELENAMNYSMIKRKSNNWYFVRNADYLAYDTSQMISKGTAEDFISNDVSIVRRGLDASVNIDAIEKGSKKLQKIRKR